MEAPLGTAHLLQVGAIRGNQRQFEAIRSNQKLEAPLAHLLQVGAVQPDAHERRDRGAHAHAAEELGAEPELVGDEVEEGAFGGGRRRRSWKAGDRHLPP